MSEERKLTHWMRLIIESLMQLELQNGNTSESQVKKQVQVVDLVKLVALKRSEKNWFYRTFLLHLEYLELVGFRIHWEISRQKMNGIWLAYLGNGAVGLTRRGWYVARNLLPDIPPNRFSPAHQDAG